MVIRLFVDHAFNAIAPLLLYSMCNTNKLLLFVSPFDGAGVGVPVAVPGGRLLFRLAVDRQLIATLKSVFAHACDRARYNDRHARKLSHEVKNMRSATV